MMQELEIDIKLSDIFFEYQQAAIALQSRDYKDKREELITQLHNKFIADVKAVMVSKENKR